MRLIQKSPVVWEIPKEGHMHVPARVYAPIGSIDTLRHDEALKQLKHMAFLPGVVHYAMAMPDVHTGYGFPIGGVAAMTLDEGAISPGGVGYDINCGVRIITLEMEAKDLKSYIADLTQCIYQVVPVGVGAKNAIPRLAKNDLTKVLQQGAHWALEQGYHIAGNDLERSEDQGCLTGAEPHALSKKAFERGQQQLGTLGSGNHFIEIDEIERIFASDVAEIFGLFEGQVVIQIHSGSRGLGHQICDDTLKQLARCQQQYGIDYIRIPNRQLAAAPFRSAEGQQYFGAMKAAANFAWANRQVMSALVLNSWQKLLGLGPHDLQARLLYDVCHNIAKKEEHIVRDSGKTRQGKIQKLLVHRKGATRAFGPKDSRIPQCYQSVGQPVLVPGDMGRYSYILVGTLHAQTETLGSACHGAGRLLSRTQARKQARGRRIDEEMRAQGIEIMAHAHRTLGEEMSEAYKDVSDVVTALVQEDIVKPVARLRPLGVVKG